MLIRVQAQIPALTLVFSLVLSIVIIVTGAQFDLSRLSSIFTFRLPSLLITTDREDRKEETYLYVNSHVIGEE